MPFEIQEFINVPSLKVIYEIPEIDGSQAAHAQKIRSQFYEHGIFPEWLGVEPTNVAKVHAFDERILTANLNYQYSDGKPGKKRFRDELGD